MWTKFAKFSVNNHLINALLRSPVDVTKNESLKFSSVFKIKPSVNCPAKPRFMQFERKNDGRLRVGATSYRGDCFVDLTGQCSTAKTMKQIIENKCNIYDLQTRLKFLRSECIDDNIRLLSPVLNPQKIMCFDYVVNTFNDCSVLVTNKLASSLTGPTDNIELEENIGSVQITVDLAVIIGQIPDERRNNSFMDYVFGYSIAHNVTAVANPGANSVVKNSALVRTSMKSFCPLGPVIIHKSLMPDPHHLWVVSCVNGVEQFCGNTSHLAYRLNVIIEAILKYTRLNAGDIILIKIPSDKAQDLNYTPCILKRGDVIESEIQDIGKLINKITTAHADEDDGCHIACC